jgi:hypothetical protein
MSAYHVLGFTSRHSVQPFLTKPPSPSGCMVKTLTMGLQQHRALPETTPNNNNNNNNNNNTTVVKALDLAFFGSERNVLFRTEKDISNNNKKINKDRDHAMSVCT